jgi:hypothetical protein
MRYVAERRTGPSSSGNRQDWEVRDLDGRWPRDLGARASRAYALRIAALLNADEALKKDAA